MSKDIDNDGIIEFTGTLYDFDQIDNDSVQYNPILCYENGIKGIQIDTSATKIINQQIWGKFYGINPIDTLMLPDNEIRYNY
jgi:hypothetical protein